MNIYEKLLVIQKGLKAPKNQRNDFGKYNYRSCEDILESVKPLLVTAQATLTIADELVLIGERYYIRATATLTDIEDAKHPAIFVTAFAREEADKKGMDGSQITGAASSYARKYALNGLFCIDDTKDADTNEQHNEREARGGRGDSRPPAKKGVTCQRCKKVVLPMDVAERRKKETGYVLCDDCYDIWADRMIQEQMEVK